MCLRVICIKLFTVKKKWTDFRLKLKRCFSFKNNFILIVISCHSESKQYSSCLVNNLSILWMLKISHLPVRSSANRAVSLRFSPFPWLHPCRFPWQSQDRSGIAGFFPWEWNIPVLRPVALLFAGVSDFAGSLLFRLPDPEPYPGVYFPAKYRSPDQ